MNQEQFDHIDDQKLLDFFYADKNNQWLGMLLKRYTLLLLGVCMKYLRNEEEARDSVQQVFEKALKELPKYRVTYFKAWIYMVAKNHCLMLLRTKQNFRAQEYDEQHTSIAEQPTDVQAHLEKDKKLELLELCLQELNDPQKECITLFYLDKTAYQEIAEKTGYSLLQVKSHIQNGKRNLKILLEKKLNNQHAS